MKLFVPLPGTVPGNRTVVSGVPANKRRGSAQPVGTVCGAKSETSSLTRKDQRCSQSEEDKINMDELSASWRVWPWGAGSWTCSIQSPEKDVVCGCGIKLIHARSVCSRALDKALR